MQKYFIAKADKLKITYYEWEIKNPKAIVHIVHGSIEYAQRYEEFAKVLNKHGYSVYAMDLRGHGKTGEKSKFGYFADEGGYQLVWQDIHAINKMIKIKHPEKKIILIGHSMGSFITRSYITQYYDTDMLIAIGSSHKTKIESALVHAWMKLKVSTIEKGKKPNRILYKALNITFARPFKNENDPLSWLSKRKRNRTLYRESKYTGFMMTNRGFYDMLFWMRICTDNQHAQNIKEGYPILLLSGMDDPVGGMGKEMIRAKKFYEKNNVNVDLIQYQDMRHEILNETNKKIVEKDILKFITKHL